MAQRNTSKPIVLVFAGPNGSGKSTITKSIPLCGEYVNADDLKRDLNLTDLEAAEKAEMQRNELVEKMANFTFETVFSTERNLLLLQKAKAKGYEVRCYYILTCNADINVARVRSRVFEGGHDVPENKVRSRYIKALKLLPEVINVCDKIFVFDNSLDSEDGRFIIFKKDEDGSSYFPNEIWPLEKLKELLKQY
jgi:predicted ABC-type ATPase